MGEGRERERRREIAATESLVRRLLEESKKKKEKKWRNRPTGMPLTIRNELSGFTSAKQWAFVFWRVFKKKVPLFFFIHLLLPFL